MDYGEVEDKEAIVNVGGVRKSMVYYEMDFGMNTVIRKKDVQVDSTAHMLIPVPGSDEGPGGVIAVLEDFLLYRANEKND
jgi:splicing factor 3B subunit 3